MNGDYIETLRTALAQLEFEIQAARDRLSQLQSRKDRLHSVIKAEEPPVVACAHKYTDEVLELRERVRRLLSQTSSEMTPPEIAAQLRATNYRYKGNEATDSRIGTELWRMAQDGEIERTKRGVYRKKNGAIAAA